MGNMLKRRLVPPWSLTRRFAIASLIVMGLITVAFSALLSYYVTDLMLRREGQVTREFVLNIFGFDGSAGYFVDQQDEALAKLFLGSTLHLQGVPDIERINIYNRDSTVLWSTDVSDIGRRFSGNPELDAALRGKLVVERGRSDAAASNKPEHQGIRTGQ